MHESNLHKPDSDAIAEALRRFDEINAADTNRIIIESTEHPTALFHANRLSYWIGRLNPTPSTALTLAARCQHLKRYEHPRSAYAEGREGYLKWRKDLSKLHAALSAEILTECGVDPQIIDEVKRINLKEGMRFHPDVQTMEDALCLLTLEHQMDGLIASSSEEQLLGIIEKVWKKMSESGRTLAGEIEHSAEVRQALTLLLDKETQSN
jgi:hypothetical protein